MMRRDYLAKAKAALADDLWVDAGSVLRQHTDTQLYYRTDHHSDDGGRRFYVYQNWAAAQKAPRCVTRITMRSAL